MGQKDKLKGWRKIAAATWTNPADPQIFGDIDVDATSLLAFVEKSRAAGAKVTVTHVVGKALAHAFAAHPDLNVRLYRNHFVRRPTVDIFFIVSAEEGRELSGVKVERADEKPVVAIAKELADRAGRIRTGTDAEFGKTKTMMARTPRPLLSLAFRAAAWITTDRDKHLPNQGLPRQPFGSAMVTSVGMFGIKHAYAPLSPYYRVPLLVLVGEVTDKPVAMEGRIEIKPILTLSATLDHRYLDGFHAARLARSVTEYLDDPGKFETS